ncbi:hypothetical protein KP13_32024 [Klebsiella pneumoniae subsp. pneumoniae Kp13]|nr:hypothetical protein KP13_32024 [Klebsiella pneumoniae subsp. pneumoniae Kp13]
MQILIIALYTTYPRSDYPGKINSTKVRVDSWLFNTVYFPCSLYGS